MAKPKFWIKLKDGKMSIFEGSRPGSIVGNPEGYDTRTQASAAKAALVLKAQGRSIVKQKAERRRGMGTPNPGKGKNKPTKNS